MKTIEETCQDARITNPVYAATLALLDRIELLSAELRRERSTQDEAFRDFKEACDKEGRELFKARADAESQLNFAREEIERLKAELTRVKSESAEALTQKDHSDALVDELGETRAHLLDRLEAVCAYSSALRAYAERGRQTVLSKGPSRKAIAWASENLPTQPTTA